MSFALRCSPALGCRLQPPHPPVPLHHIEELCRTMPYCLEWNDFNLELNVVLASTCTVQVDAPRATIITALGGWIFRDFGALWSKVPCSISDFNGNIIDVFIIWCFFLHLRFFRCCCVQSPGLLIKRRALEVIMKLNVFNSWIHSFVVPNNFTVLSHSYHLLPHTCQVIIDPSGKAFFISWAKAWCPHH